MAALKKDNKSGVSLYTHDLALAKQYGAGIIGVDEAGRGPLAGPVVAAAVLLDLDKKIEGVNDSKKLSAQKRELLYDKITSEALAWGVGSASPKEIDKINILQATLLAMHRAIEKLKEPWKIALIDGNKTIPFIPSSRQLAIVDGDALSASIAAASIIAKVTRDRIMEEYHQKYPVYDFQSNKGYATEFHRSSIVEHGLCEIHRKSFCEVLVCQTRLPL